MEEKEYAEYLESFEKRLEAGLSKICCSLGVLTETANGALLGSSDIDSKWEDYIKDYVADAVENFDKYPDAALGWAAYLGMAVANHWDRDWNLFKDDSYKSYYGDQGWDNMDEHIVGLILKLQPVQAKKVSDALMSCSTAIQAFIRHEGIEAQTVLGFYALVRSYGVMFRVGAAIELQRLGYKVSQVSDIHSNRG